MDFLNTDGRGLQKFQFYFRQHWMRMLWPLVRTALLTMLIIAITIFAFTGAAESQGARMTTAGFLLVSLLFIQFWFLTRFYRYFLHVTVVTDTRVHSVRKTLLTYDEHESIDLWLLQDVRKVQRGPVQNAFGFGSIHLESADMQLRLHFVPHVSERYADILRLLEMARSRRIITQPKRVE